MEKCRRNCCRRWLGDYMVRVYAPHIVQDSINSFMTTALTTTDFPDFFVGVALPQLYAKLQPIKSIKIG